MSHEEQIALLPLYAIHSLTSVETAEIEEHLETCSQCRAELDGYHATAAALIPDSEAPASVWERISAGVDEEMAPVKVITPKQGPSPWVIISGVAAAIALVLGGLVVIQRTLISGLTGDSAVALAAERAAEEPGALVSDFLVDGTAVAQVILTEDGRGFVVPSDDLPALDAARTYQLWVINDDEDVISAGVLGNDPAAATFTWTGPVAGFALTREVAGGVISSAGDVVSVISDLG
jgi:anti-sigma-K factor RskA